MVVAIGALDGVPDVTALPGQLQAKNYIYSFQNATGLEQNNCKKALKL
jgi:hypothetical protein